ncbi:GNAT family N-acetyltransferase [Shimia isoporae]|nr:GNAT family N-acetyltransferase [Shimia isoporae]
MDDAARCFEIEAAAYAEDEAATLAKIATRIEGYPEGFLILELGGTIVGFINSGCAHEVEMSDDAFKELIGHDAEARDVVIMSVVLDPDFQGRGLATSLMTEFVTRMKAAGKEQIHLMCKENYRPLYERFGYKFTKPSRSTHGGAQWYEMVMNLTF